VRTVTFLVFGSLLLLTGGCSGTGPASPDQETISREQFVEAYLELRRKSLRSPRLEIDLSDRDQILEELGLTEEDLLTFAEVWGGNPDVMESIWQEVDSILREDRRGPRGDAFSDDEEPDEEGGIDFRGEGRS
jgi:hypothetical protein